MESEQELMKRFGRNCDEGRCREILPKGYGDGPWEAEPSRVDFRAFGLPCFIHRAPITGSWCGYVGVTKQHPAFGHPYDSVSVSVHGGLTYGAKCSGHICHPGGGNIFWLGYDCGHAGDYSPRMEALMRELRLLPLPGHVEYVPKRRKEGDGPAGGLGSVTYEDDGTVVLHEHYWTMEEVIRETKDLARQLRDCTGHNIKVQKRHRGDLRKSLDSLKKSMAQWELARKYGLGSSKFNPKRRGRRP